MKHYVLNLIALVIVLCIHPIQGHAADTLNNGLVGYWKFEELSPTKTLQDYSPLGNNPGIGGANVGIGNNVGVDGVTTSIQPKFGKALVFNKDVFGQYMSTTLNFASNQWTLSLWVNPVVPIPTTSPYSGNLVFFSVDYVSGQQFLVLKPNGIDLTSSGSPTKLVQYNFNANPGWHHIVLSYDGTTLTAVIDNSVESSIPYRNLLSNNIKRILGVLSTGARAHNFVGLMDEVRLYNRELSRAEKALLFDPTIVIPTTPPQLTKTWPTGPLPSWTRYSHIAVYADRPVICKASKEPGKTFRNMPLQFNNVPMRKVSLNVTYPRPGQNLRYYVSCQDIYGLGRDMTVDISIERDVIPPEIIDLQPSSVRENTAEIVWMTHERADSVIEYREQGKPDFIREVDNSFAYPHAQLLEKLKPNTTYEYRVSSSDFSGNKTTSTLKSFKTRGAAPGRIYYIATAADGGNNANDGLSIDKPFATLEKARDTIRLLKTSPAGLPEGGVHVMIRRGTYYLTAPFILSTQDSGTATKPIIYRAYNDEEVSISGGKNLTGFTPIATTSPIYNRLNSTAKQNVVQLSTAMNKTALEISGAYVNPVLIQPSKEMTLENNLMVYFDNKPMTLARWPNVDPQSFANGFTTVKATPNGTTSNVIVTTDNRPSTWPNTLDNANFSSSDIWVHGAWYYDYRATRLKVTAIKKEASGGYRLTIPNDPTGLVEAGRPFHYENVPEELDSPGEWYMDRTSTPETLYFWPPAPITSAKTHVTMIKNLVWLQGTVSYITFSGMIFEHARGRTVITDTLTSFNSFENCTIRNVTYAAYIAGKQNGIFGCHIHNIDDNAVMMYGGYDIALEPGYNYVVNSKIHDYGLRNYTYKAAVNMTAMGVTTYTSPTNGTRSVGNRARYNEIFDAPHFGIVFRGNNLLVDYNHIYNVMTKTMDGGAIYTFGGWSARGNMIRYNYIHDIPGFDFTASRSYLKVMGIYVDNDVCGIDAYGNVLNRIRRPANAKGAYKNVAYFTHGGRDNTFENNIIVNSDQPLEVGAPGLGFLAKMFRVPIANVTTTSPIEIKTQRPHENFFINDSINPPGKIVVSDVLGQTAANGEWANYTIIDDYTIRLTGSTSVAPYTQGGFLMQDPQNYTALTKYNNLTAPYSTYYPTYTRVMLEIDDAEPKGIDIKTNILHNNIDTDFDKMYHGGMFHEKLKELVLFENSLTMEPQFVDFSKDNFNLQDTSAAFSNGFKPIPFDRIGLLEKDRVYDPDNNKLLGDVSGNKRVSIYDAVMILRYLRNPALFNASQEELADVNRQDGINNDDATLVAKYALGIITSFTIVE